MTEKEIFGRLFSISHKAIIDGSGIVISCLVRDGNIVAEGASPEKFVHSEYWLIQEMQKMGIKIRPSDIVYATVEPCGKRSPGGPGEKMGDCTTALIGAGVKHVVYAAADPDASQLTRHKFAAAGVTLTQVADPELVKRAIDLFNRSPSDSHKPLPE